MRNMGSLSRLGVYSRRRWGSVLISPVSEISKEKYSSSISRLPIRVSTMRCEKTMSGSGKVLEPDAYIDDLVLAHPTAFCAIFYFDCQLDQHSKRRRWIESESTVVSKLQQCK